MQSSLLPLHAIHALQILSCACEPVKIKNLLWFWCKWVCAWLHLLNPSFIIDMKLEWCYKDVLKCCDILLITDLELQAHETNHVLWFGTLQRQSYFYSKVFGYYNYMTISLLYRFYEYRLVVSHKCFTSTTFFELALEDSHTPLNTNWLASFQTSFPPSSFRVGRPGNETTHW